MRPGDGMEPQKIGIPDLNLPTQEETSENARAEIDAGKLKALAPNHEEQDEEAPESAAHDEIAINYVNSGESWNRATTIVDTYFANKITTIIDHEPEHASLMECRMRSDWEDWQKAITAELLSLNEREVFGPVCRTPPHIKPVGYK